MLGSGSTSPLPSLSSSILPFLRNTFVEDCVSALTEETELRRRANRLVFRMDRSSSVEEITSAYRASPEPSAALLSGIRDQVERGISKLRRSGCIQSSCRQMGISPRIVPQGYGVSINSTNNFVRGYGYTLAAQSFGFRGYPLVDVGLRSAYTSVLLGLCPTALQRMRLILRGTSLWGSIKEGYRRAGKLGCCDALISCVFRGAV